MTRSSQPPARKASPSPAPVDGPKAVQVGSWRGLKQLADHTVPAELLLLAYLCTAVLGRELLLLMQASSTTTSDCALLQGAGKGKRVMGGKPLLGGDAQPSGDVAMQDMEQPTTTGRLPIDRALVGGSAGVLLQCRQRERAPAHSCTPALQVRLPLDVGTLVDAIWRDGLLHQARIIERRKVPGGTTEEDYEYYVHYRKRESRGAL